jgi:hypothetical protein
LRGTTADEIERALARVAGELGWTADPRGDIELAVVDAGDSVWLTAATPEIPTLAAGLARELGRGVRLYTVEADQRELRCAGRSVRADGTSDPIDGTLDTDTIAAMSASPDELAEERLRVLLDASEDIDADRGRTSRRYAARPRG